MNGSAADPGDEARFSDNRELERYELCLGDDERLAALIDYRLSDRWIALLHTETQPGFEGRGIGSRIATLAFDDARERDLKIIPKCPFIVRWLERHPEQHDVLLRPLAPPGEPPVTGGPLEMS